MPENENTKPFHDCLHALAQPLTAIQCQLELALQKDASIAEYREALSVCLTLSRSALARLTFERELQEAATPTRCEPFDFADVVRELEEEFTPIAESLQLEVFWDTRVSGISAVGNAKKFHDAAVRVLDHVLARSTPGDRIAIQLSTAAASKLWIEFEQPQTADLTSPPLQISDAALRSMNGELCPIQNGFVLELPIPPMPIASRP